MKIINLLDGQPVDIADSGLPPELIGLLSILGEEPQLCDCPPGVCLGEGPASDTFDPDLVSDSGDESDQDDDDDDFEVEFEPFFDLDDEEVSQEDKVEAVAQLGRIIEGMTVIVEKHANLLKDLVG